MTNLGHLPRLIGIGRAVPSNQISQEQAKNFVLEVLHADQKAGKIAPRDAEALRILIERIYQRSGIQTRHTVLADFLDFNPGQFQFFGPSPDLLPLPTTGKRMAEYKHYAVALARRACQEALEQAQLDPQRITHLIFASCTGFFAPGPDCQLVQELSLNPQTQRYLVGFMGCQAGLTGLRLAHTIIKSDPRACVLQVCVELCSLHYQRDWSTDTIISNAIFADGAAAAVWTGLPDVESCFGGRLSVRQAQSHVLPDSQSQMAWTIGDEGFQMMLGPQVPEIIQRAAPGIVQSLLKDWSEVSLESVKWVIHPGGRRIIDGMQTSFHLSDPALTTSRRVLAQYGNMSSGTVLFVLHEWLQDAVEREAQRESVPLVALAFGPGLSVESVLMEWSQ
jgi:predicted naringenin-chalcone synthase